MSRFVNHGADSDGAFVALYKRPRGKRVEQLVLAANDTDKAIQEAPRDMIINDKQFNLYGISGAPR